jgi:hypothetical protein
MGNGLSADPKLMIRKIRDDQAAAGPMGDIPQL